MKRENNLPFDRDGYYSAVNEACATRKDAELGFEILTQVRGATEQEITERDLTNARLYVNHCKNPLRDETFRNSEMLVIQKFTGNHSVLLWECSALGFEIPRRMSAHERHEQLTREMQNLQSKLDCVAEEIRLIEPIARSEERMPTLVEYPGSFSAKTIGH